jgi:hypothetical protein
MTASEKTLKMKQFKCFCTTYACTIPQCDTSNQARGCTYTSKNCPYQTSPFWKQQQHSHHPTTYNDLPLTAISSIPFDTLFFQQQTLLLSPWLWALTQQAIPQQTTPPSIPECNYMTSTPAKSSPANSPRSKSCCIQHCCYCSICTPTTKSSPTNSSTKSLPKWAL